jgi:prepilin-type N-terminal cleavage/methylation domain-containing protein
MRARGFALSELLIAVAIAGLIVSVLTFLDVDYVGFARRVVDIGRPLAMGGRAEAGGDADRCAHPETVLTAGDNEVDAVARDPADKTAPATVLSLGANGAATTVLTAQGSAGSSERPVRVVVESAPAHGGSMAAIEVGDATVGVIAPRCDLKEVCEYDATNAACLEPDTNAADATNAADGGNAIAGHG